MNPRRPASVGRLSALAVMTETDTRRGYVLQDEGKSWTTLKMVELLGILLAGGKRLEVQDTSADGGSLLKSEIR